MARPSVYFWACPACVRAMPASSRHLPHILGHFCLFVCNRGDTIQYHGHLQSRELGQSPLLLVFLTSRQALSSHLHQQMVWLYWLQDRDSMPDWYAINHFTHTMKPSDPLLLVDGTLHCGMYPTGRVAISRHIATQGSPSVTILLASSVPTLVHCEV